MWKKVPALLKAAIIASTGVILAAIITGVFVLFKEDSNGSMSASTTGKNFPAVNMSGTTSGTNSPLTQAATGATVGDKNVSMSATLSGTSSTLIQANNSTVNYGTAAQQQPKPCPIFQFALSETDDMNDLVWLTNDFLKVTKFDDNGPNPFKTSGLLFLPTKRGTNILLRLFLKNNSSEADAENPEATVAVSGILNSVANTWENDGTCGEILANAGSRAISTNTFERFGYALPHGVLLRGDGTEIPPIQIMQIETFSVAAIVILEARSVDSPAETVAFVVFSPTNAPFNVVKPFIIETDDDKCSISNEKARELVNEGFISLK